MHNSKKSSKFAAKIDRDMYPKLENRPWKVVKSENILHLGPWLSVRQECVELPSGKQIPTWFVLEFPDWINVIAITKDGKMVMEDQYRHALGETHYELVAGVIDPGETPLEAAKRELSEETGYEGGEWQLFMTLSPNPTNHNNKSYTFLARKHTVGCSAERIDYLMFPAYLPDFFRT